MAGLLMLLAFATPNQHAKHILDKEKGANFESLLKP